MPHDADVVIVGAGPSGCAAAMTLGRRGYRVTVLDRATFPRDKPCGDYCNPGAVEALGALGCLSSVQQAGASFIEGMHIVAQDGSIVAPQFPTGRGLLLRRLVLDEALVNAAARAGTAIVEGTPVLEVRPSADGVLVQTGRGRPLTAALVIVCDGMHSAIGHRLGLLAPIAPRRYTVGAYFSGFAGPPRGEIHLGRGRYCGLARFGDGVANVCMALPRDALRHRTAERTFWDGIRTFPMLADALLSARRESPYRSSGPIGFRSNRVVFGRVMLAGDAAAQIDPMTGQGMFFALRSGMLAAEAAADALAAGLPVVDLRTYRRRRQAVLGPKVRAGRVLQALALRPHLTPWLIQRLRAHPHLAEDLVGVTGDVRSPDTILNPRYVMRLLQH